MRKCSKCKILKETSEFYKVNGKRKRFSTYCKPCFLESGRVQKTKYHKSEAFKNAARKHRLKKIFGITVEIYDALFREQNGNCAICKRNQSVFNRRLAVDHCHESKKIRGLLCSECNTALGSFHDNTETILRAVSYLKGEK